MSDVYRIFGAEVSPYSVKVRSYFRYKGIPHEWILRSKETMEEFQKYAKLPLIPVVATPTPNDTTMRRNRSRGVVSLGLGPSEPKSQVDRKFKLHFCKFLS